MVDANISAIEAIKAISPSAKVIVSEHQDGSRDIIWEDTPEISEADIDAKVVSMQAEYDAQEYARNRATAYDSVGDQLDQLMKDMRDGTTTHQTACEAVKAKFPKPE